MRKILLLLIIALSSCKENPKVAEYKKLIVGDWTIVYEDNTDIIPGFKPNFGYAFFEDGICEDKFGYYNYSDKSDERLLEYYGSTTQYKFEDDSLKVYNLITKKWSGFKINKLTTDSLIFSDYKGNSRKFIRKIYPEYDNINNNFDEIIVSTTSCYGSCPTNDTYIKKTGEVIYLGHAFNKNDGYFSSKISLQKFIEIENRFKKADLINLKNRYSYTVTDLSETSVVFIKDRKIIKSITDYGAGGPIELIWAYTPVVYISQQLELIPRDTTNYYGLSHLEAKRNNDILKFSEAESYYLSILLEKGKHTTEKVDKKYRLTAVNNDINKIDTNGRLYRIYFKNGTLKTIDIGFNFMDNKFSKNFKNE